MGEENTIAGARDETQGRRREAPAGVSGLRPCPRPPAETYDVGLLDLDGVVYLDGEPILSAPPAVRKAMERGMRFAYVTNNASRTPRRIAQRLGSLGLPSTADRVVTSAQAAARLVADRVPPDAAVLVIGAIGLRQAVRAQGLRLAGSAADEPAAVIQGYDPQLSYSQLAEGTLAVRRGALFVVSNADPTMPTPRGQLPGNGSLARVVATATGVEPVVAGKPELPLHREALERTGAGSPLVVGDRLDTDVEGAARAGTPSLLVLTGVTEPAGVVAAPPGLRPTHLAGDLGGLLDPHPEVTYDGFGWDCGGWYARNDGGRLELARASTGGRARQEEVGTDPYDGLRALCAAAWSARGPLQAAALNESLAQLGLA